MVGPKLRKLRKEKGWTQMQLEERTGIDQKNIRSYEAGKLSPSPRTMQKFANAFEVEVSEIVGENPSHAALVLEDDELLQLFRDLQRLPEADVNRIKWMISLAVKQHRVQSVMAS